MFNKSIVALITPMDNKGYICKKSLKQIIDYHINSGTSAIVSVGTTGESATLNYEEHGYVIMTTLELADGRIPIIAGTGSNSTAEAIELTKRFEKSGVVACLTVTPYYNRPTQEGIYQHFKAIAENTSLPQILYNVPARTGCDMLPTTIGKLSLIKNIIGVKEATGDLSRISQIKKLVNDDFILMSGDDKTALDFMRLGGHGVISVTANIAAHEMVTLCNLAYAKDFVAANNLNWQLMSIHETLFCEPNPIAVKWVAKKLGLILHDNVRLPLTKLSDHSEILVNQALIKSNLL